MKIAMFGHKRIPSREGGIEVVVEELCIRMAKAGHEVTCYNRKGHHVSGAEFDNDKIKIYKGIRIKDVLTIKKKGLAAFSAAFFASIFTAFGKYDIVHIHAEGPAIFCWIPKVFGKKVIVTVHGIDHFREKWKGSIGARLILWGEKCAVRFADEIIVLSKSAQEYFKETYNRKTVIIPNGVDRFEFSNSNLIKKNYGLEKGSYLLFVGRLVPEKGLRYLIEAFKCVDTDKRLVIAGGSSDTPDFKKELEEMAKEDERILFTNFVQGQTLKELYSNAYIYILPSDLEGMPLSLLEAMSFGNCCLTSDIEECANLVEDFAMTFEKGNVEDLKQKMQLLCNDEKLVCNYKKGVSNYICEKYKWDDVVRQTLSIYKREVGQNESFTGK